MQRCFCAREGPAGSCSVSAEVQQAQVTPSMRRCPQVEPECRPPVSTCNKDEKDSSYQLIFWIFPRFPLWDLEYLTGNWRLIWVGVPASFLTCQVGGETQAEEAVVTTQAGGEATDHGEQTRGREGASLPPDRAGLFSCEVPDFSVSYHWTRWCVQADFYHKLMSFCPTILNFLVLYFFLLFSTPNHMQLKTEMRTSDHLKMY